ncbi:MAG: hypothetical protein EZS28_021555 [Streblomastix strix]|uniref:non-specific serine/threonine protein kinase n=1 Tax=Streblomastix strix TaxID=222440 RepID=A0A5J4VKQ0_9EUKA|nr:MAG: hypothetical protein EZS28_021555 [Streblomastix strix]
MFAIGLVVFELLTGQHPFNANNEQAIIDKIKKGEHQQLPDFVPSDLKYLFISMLNNDPIKRPTIEDVLNNEKIKKQINEFKEFKDDKTGRELTTEQFKRIKNEIKSVTKTAEISHDQITKLTHGMKTVRIIRSGKAPQIKSESYDMTRELIDNCSLVIQRTIKNEKNVDISFQADNIVPSTQQNNHDAIAIKGLIEIATGFINKSHHIMHYAFQDISLFLSSSFSAFNQPQAQIHNIIQSEIIKKNQKKDQFIAVGGGIDIQAKNFKYDLKY